MKQVALRKVGTITGTTTLLQSIGTVALCITCALPSLAIPAIQRTPVAPSSGTSTYSRTQPTATSAPRYDPDLYVLGPGDQLQLVFLDPSAAGLGSTFGILNDGTATLSLLGTVQLTGLTIGQANRWLTSLYSKQLLRPNLYLNITGPRPMSVTVLGEVQTPGLYQLNSRGEGSAVVGTAGGSAGVACASCTAAGSAGVTGSALATAGSGLGAGSGCASAGFDSASC